MLIIAIKPIRLSIITIDIIILCVVMRSVAIKPSMLRIFKINISMLNAVKLRYLQYLCRPKDFGHEQDKMVQNLVKNDSLS